VANCADVNVRFITFELFLSHDGLLIIWMAKQSLPYIWWVGRG
jgi:hypothetical protein